MERYSFLCMKADMGNTHPFDFCQQARAFQKSTLQFNI